VKSRMVSIALAAFLACGCAASSNTKIKTSEQPVGAVLAGQTAVRKVCGVTLRNATDAQAKIAESALREMRLNVISRINYIEAATSKRACKEFILGPANQSAHCHPYDQGIHILTGYFDETRIWHEATHAWHQTLEKNLSDFSPKWIKITGDGGLIYINIERYFPSKGVMNLYGTTTHFEDVAEWVEQIYCFKRGMENVIARIKDKNDPRYIQKLELLLEYEFIGEKEFDLVKAKLLGEVKEEVKKDAVKIPFPVFGADEKDLEIIAQAVLGAPMVVLRSVPALYVFRDNSTRHFGPKHGGHRHPKSGKTIIVDGTQFEGDGRICILKTSLYEPLLRHEMAHAHEKTLSQIEVEEWINYSGKDAYIMAYADKNIKFPYRGILSRDGAENYSEDIGYWVDEILRLKNKLWCLFMTGRIDWNDGVYLKKLNFLKDKKFITEDEFDTVLKTVKK